MGLRKIASTAASSASTSVNVLDFAKSLLKLFPRSVYGHGRKHGARPQQIGLAISGGVDSMALAMLFSQLKGIRPSDLECHDNLQNLQLLQACKFKAFIVNHGVREGSLEEAQSVAECLIYKGIPAEVLTINWPTQNGFQPAKQQNFESLARKYRFQTLGKACYREGISALLLAHHQDDQAETLLMRLANGHRSLGLTGIKSAAAIPECHGLYGVHESGDVHSIRHHSTSSTPSWINDTKSQLEIASGGIRIYRPLLSFSKVQLKTTCERAGMEWFEDHTNQDPTLTMRNAVRKLYKSHQIPTALSKPALLALSKRARERVAAQHMVVNKLMSKCDIARFESRSGVLQIRLPDLSKLAAEHAEKISMISIAAMLLRRIIELITPYEHVDLNALHNILPTLFPELSSHTPLPNISSPTKQTIAGVQFTPLAVSPTSSPSSPSQSPKPLYLLSRQPFPRTQPCIHHIAVDTGSWSSWTLIDNRYWMSVKGSYPNVVIRSLEPAVLHDFLTELDVEKRKMVKVQLRRLAPGNVRWTLLALIVEGRCVGLPTLDMYVDGWGGKVEVMYKKVNFDGLRIGREE